MEPPRDADGMACHRPLDDLQGQRERAQPLALTLFERGAP